MKMSDQKNQTFSLMIDSIYRTGQRLLLNLIYV